MQVTIATAPKRKCCMPQEYAGGGGLPFLFFLKNVNRHMYACGHARQPIRQIIFPRNRSAVYASGCEESWSVRAARTAARRVASRTTT
jgi:hypothetical protein